MLKKFYNLGALSCLTNLISKDTNMEFSMYIAAHIVFIEWMVGLYVKNSRTFCWQPGMRNKKVNEKKNKRLVFKQNCL